MSKRSPLSLHVPEPEFRPGSRPDFSGVTIPKAGSVRRPSVDVAPEEVRDLGYSIIRVLNRAGEAVGPWSGELSDEALLDGLKTMMKVRAYDVRMQMAQRQGKTSFYMQCTGEEAIACAFQKALEKGDMNFPTYRQQGLLIASGYPLVDMMCQIYSNSNDPMKGRQLPVMYSSKKHCFFSISGNLGTQYPQAVGWAMASAIKGDTRIAAGWIGDGSTAEVRLSRRARVCLDLQGAGRPQHCQQPVGHLHISGHRSRRLGDVCGARTRLRYSRAARRRQRLSGRVCGREMGHRARPAKFGSDTHRVRHVSGSSPFEFG